MLRFQDFKNTDDDITEYRAEFSNNANFQRSGQTQSYQNNANFQGPGQVPNFENNNANFQRQQRNYVSGQTVVTRKVTKDGQTKTSTVTKKFGDNDNGSGDDVHIQMSGPWTSYSESYGNISNDEDNELDLGGGRVIRLKFSLDGEDTGKQMQQAFEQLAQHSKGKNVNVQRNKFEDNFKMDLIRKAQESAFSDKGKKTRVEDKQKEIVRNFDSDLSVLKSIRQWFGSDGRLTKPTEEKLESMVSVNYNSLKKSLDLPEEMLLNILEELGYKLSDSGIVSNICGVVTMMYPNLYTIGPSKLDPGFAHAFGLIWNYADASEVVARNAALAPGFVRKMAKILEHLTSPHLDSDLKPHDNRVLQMAVASTHNLCAVEENIALLRKEHMVSILQPYLKSRDEEISLMALSIIAAIMDESESEILKTDTNSVKLLMRRLTRAIDDPHRRDEKGWSTSDLARTISRLARSDAYKRELMKFNVLSALVKMGKNGTIREQAEVVNAIWGLAFDDNNKKEILANSQAMELLKKCKTSDIIKVRVGAEGALWTLERSTEKKAEERDTTGTDEGHIMISYNWGHQNTLLKVRDALKKKGYKVWMDVDEMQGSTLEAMANAVEKASLVLICMSQKYKDSSNCRAEAEYTFKLGKPIVPLLMEDFRPDGWLGMIAGTKLYFDFSGKYPFQEKLDGLFKEIKSAAPAPVNRAAGPKPSTGGKQPNISLRLLNDAKQMFDYYDTNDDGRLDLNELKNLMCELGQNPTDQEARAIMKEADLNGNGYIDYPEYVNLLMKVLKDPEEIKEELAEAFHKFTKGSGFLNLKQLKSAVTSIGEPLSEKEAAEMFKLMDKNKDKKIDVNEFVNFLCERFTPKVKRR